MYAFYWNMHRINVKTTILHNVKYNLDLIVIKNKFFMHISIFDYII